MSNSGLVVYTKLSPNHSGQRTHGIDRITPHCVVGQLSCEGICDCFPAGSGASCNYGIGTDGRISLCVEEKNRSWCSSSNANDQRAVTIECSSDKTAPYVMTDAVYESLVTLCTDICKRNGKDILLWLGGKERTLAYEPKDNEMLITVHRWFANKSCPGNWLYARLADLSARVTANLTGGNGNLDDGVLYRVQAGAFTEKANADAMLAKVKAAGFDAFITTESDEAATNPVNPYPVPARVIKYIPGNLMTGDDVRWVQWRLRAARYDIEIDGKFGPASDRALRAYQAMHGLEVDGKCGAKTMASMMGD